MDMMDTYLMHRYQGGLVGQPPCFGGLELVTISKLLSLFTCLFIYLIFSMFMFLGFVLYVVYTSLNVVFVKTRIYTWTNSEQHLIHIRLHFIAHLYSLYAHV